jgi:hypothetical protein
VKIEKIKIKGKMHKWTKNAKQKNKGPKEKQVAWELSSWMKNNKTFGL